MSKPIEAFNGYNDYISCEWQYFVENPDRATAILDAAKDVEVRKVLDVGCGAGQEMLPFIERGAFGVGIDVAPEVGTVGRKMFAKHKLNHQIAFLRASGDQLPFASDSFDVSICRIALMYMNTQRTLTEISRVLRSGGVFLLKIHAPRFYLEKAKQGLKNGNWRSAVHAGRVLFAGNWYKATGRQLFNKFTAGGEVFLTRKVLSREIEPLGMQIIGEMPDTNPQTPSFVLRKL